MIRINYIHFSVNKRFCLQKSRQFDSTTTCWSSYAIIIIIINVIYMVQIRIDAANANCWLLQAL